MTEDNGRHSDETGDDESPVTELADLRVDPNPDLAGRVQRDINRRTLVADGLDFSLNVMLMTFWEHLRSAIESWPGNRPSDPNSEPKQGAD